MDKTKTPMTFWQRLKFRNWRIFVKFVVVLFVLSVIPLLLVTAIGGNEAERELTEQAKVNISRLANSTAKRIEQLLSDNHNIITMLASDQDVVTFISQDRVGSVQPEAQANVDHTIFNARDSHDTIELVSVFDSDGWVIAHTKDYLIDTQWSFREYFQQAIRGNKYLSGILIGTKDDTPGVFGSAPVYDENGSEIIGVLSTKIRGTYITNILDNTLLSDKGRISDSKFSEGEVYLINKYGIVMAHSDPESDWLYHSLGPVSEEDVEIILDIKMLGGDCPEAEPDCASDDKIPREPQPMPALEDLGNELVAKMLAGESGSLRYCRPIDLSQPAAEREGKCSGDWHQIGYATVTNPVSETGEGILLVVVDIPDEVFLGNINAFVNKAVWGAAILGALILVISLVVARTLAKPIGQLSQTAQDVENHKPFQPDDIAMVMALGDEVGHLARVFSSMVLALRARMAELRTIYEIGNKINDSVELADTLSEVVDSLGKVIGFDAAEICLYNAKKKTLDLYVTNVSVMSDDETVEKVIYDPKKDYFPQLFDNRYGFVVDDIDSYSELSFTSSRSWDAFEPKSYLGISLRYRENVVGTIEMVCSQVNGFSEDNKRILESVSIQAAVAISNAREVKDRERRLMNMEIMIDDERVNEEINAVTNRDFFQSLRKKLHKEKTK